MKYVLAGLGLAAALAACGPIYRTDYTYRPPPDAEGRRCATQCGTAQAICRDSAQQQARHEAERCEWEAQRNYEDCLRKTPRDQQDKECYRSTCYGGVNDARCDDDFRVCFQTCGGVVEGRQVCTANCEK